MKRILISVVSVLMVIGGLVPWSADADQNEWIRLTVMYEGTQIPVPYLEMTFTRNGTNDSVIEATDEDGICFVMLDDFITWDEGDIISVEQNNMEDEVYVCHADIYLDPDYPSHQYHFKSYATDLPGPDFQLNTCTYQLSIFTMNVVNHDVNNVLITRGKDINDGIIQDNSNVPVPAFYYNAYVISLTLAFCPCANDATYVAPNQQLWTEIEWIIQMKTVSQDWDDEGVWSSTTGPIPFYIYYNQPVNSNAPNLIRTMTIEEFTPHRFDIRVQSIIIEADDIEGQDTYPDDCENVPESDYTISNVAFNYQGGGG